MVAPDALKLIDEDAKSVGFTRGDFLVACFLKAKNKKAIPTYEESQRVWAEREAAQKIRDEYLREQQEERDRRIHLKNKKKSDDVEIPFD